MINLVIFDMDGILVDLCHAHRAAFRAALDEVTGHHIDHATERTLEGLPTIEKCRILGLKPSVSTAVNRRKQQLTGPFCASLRPNKARCDAVRAVARNHLVVCYSNSLPGTALEALRKAELYDLLDKVYGSSDVPAPKPSPAGYNKIMRDFKVLPDQVLVFEDSSPGIQAAAEAGCFVVPTTLEHITASNVLFAITQTNEIIKCNY
jgi:beta-phosphoglucomutase-like phosphatase (HAD superfamily)